MARVHKVSFYIADANGEYNTDDIDVILDNKFNASLIEIESSEEFEWGDDLPINMWRCDKHEFEKYFDEEY